MKQITKRMFALLMVLAMCLSLVPAMETTAAAATVEYVYASDGTIKNWGTRDVVATFMSPNAELFYESNNTSYAELAQLAGSTSTSSVPSSPLYQELQDLMESNHSYKTSYNATRDMYQYTDCQNSGKTSNKISSFYSGNAIGPAWDSGATWNREHTWPDSKGLAGSDENDIMMLRPTAKSENSSRSNTAYGESSSYYDPNKYGMSLHGDVARIMLYQYVRWGNTGKMWGSSGVMESKEVLLKWMEEDPVDTWELGRNDSVESITGTRNVFVDFPELAFLLFGANVPTNYITPSGSASDGTVTPVLPNTPETPALTLSYVDAPAVDTAYKFVLNQAGLGKHLGFTGEMSGYYYGTSEDIDAMVDVYLEEASGGYSVYFLDGTTKVYLNVIPRDNDATKTNVVMQTLTENASPSVYELNTEFKYLKTACVGTEWYLGTYGTNKSISASKTSYISDTSTIGVSQFTAWFAIVGEDETPDTPVVPDEPVEPGINYVDAPAVDTAYKFVLNQAGLGQHLGFTGEMSGYYYGTSEDIDAMVDVYLETAEGGYRVYFLDGTTKVYLNVIPRDNDATKTNVVLQTLAENAAPSVYELNTEFKYLKTACVGTEWYLGTYGTNKSISASKTSYISDTSTIGVSQFTAWFATAGAGETPDVPVIPDEPETPDADGTVLTIVQAIAKGSAMEHNTFTDVKYKVTGEITEVYNTTYGNMRIKDEAGNILTVYGTYDATGENRYDAMTVKPVAGDTVTVYGIIGQYNGTPQVKDGWIVEHTPATTPDVPETPEETTGKYKLIDKVANLKAGTYKMAAYLTVDSNKADLSAAPYHLWDGTINSGDLVTNSYAFADNDLTAASKDASANVEIVAVEGKANTYYVMVDGQYLYSTASATNRKLAFGADPVEWVATDNTNGGITLSSNSVYLGSASALSKFIRSYKGESTLKYGVVFFAAN